MAILLFGRHRVGRRLDADRISFNRLHGDSFIWTEWNEWSEWTPVVGFNRLHGDSFIWTHRRSPRCPRRLTVSIAFMAILLFGLACRSAGK